MQKNTGTDRVAGAVINLSVMSDCYVEIILGALESVDDAYVWKSTDDVSTVIRGRYEHVFDVVKAIYLHAAKTGEHVAMSGTFGIGCNKDNDAEDYLKFNEDRLNEKDSSEISQVAGCKYSIYAVGVEDYMSIIQEEVSLAEEKVQVTPDHFSTRLDGEVNDIFAAIENSFVNVANVVPHTKITFTISCNSPSQK